MTVQELSQKYNIPTETISAELLPIAQEESESMGKGNDQTYIFSVLEELCKGYLAENVYGGKYKSLFDNPGNKRYEPLFGDSLPYQSIIDSDEELDEEIEGVMGVDGVQSTDFDSNMLPEYPVGMTADQVNKKKKKYGAE